MLHSDTCIHSCEFVHLYFHFLLRIISINYKTDRTESYSKICDSVTLSGHFSVAVENEYAFLRLQESNDEPFYKTPSISKVIEILLNVRLSNVKLSSPSHLLVLQATYWNLPCRAAGRFLRPQPDTAPCYGEREPTQRASEFFCYRICDHG
jgi:hypothetical protein